MSKIKDLIKLIKESDCTKKQILDKVNMQESYFKRALKVARNQGNLITYDSKKKLYSIVDKNNVSIESPESFENKHSVSSNKKSKAAWEDVLVKEGISRKVHYHNIDADKFTIMLMGDEHLGSKYYDYDFHMENIEWCYEHKVPIILMGDEMECMDFDTQILTEDGWKYFWEIKNFMVATYNKDRNIIEYQKPIKKVIHNYSGNMYHFKNKKLDMFVTPNHRILCRHHKGKLQVRKAEKFNLKSSKARCWNIPCASNWKIQGYDFTDSQIKLLGWIITEGWVEKRLNSYRYYTSQSKNVNRKNYDEIINVLNNCGLDWHERFNEETKVSSFRFTDKRKEFVKFIGNNTKQIGRIILNNFSVRQLKLLYETLIKGDGTKKGEFFTISNKLKDDFLELCCKIGLVTSVTRTRLSLAPNSKKDKKLGYIWIIYSGNGKGNKGTKKMMHKSITDLELVNFNGPVWCVSVPNSFLVVKRNDCVFITGNTATKTSVGAGVFEQDDIVQEQLEKIVKIYKPMAEAGLILGNHIGNHEARVRNHSGANLSKILATMLKIPYLGVGAVNYFKVGKQSYLLYTTHGTSGARTAHTKIANTIKMANMIDVDIYAQGHLHQLSHHVQNYYNVNKKNKTIEEANKHYIITGSYLSHWGSYAHVANLEPARKGSPKINMDGIKRIIRVSLG